LPDPSPPSTHGDDDRLRHRPALDGLRGIAILLVVGHHLVLGGRRAIPGGFIGVDVFFVLSGALITMLLVHERQTTGRIRLRAFWMRRVIRLLPALFAMLALVVLYTAIAWPSEQAAGVRVEALYAVAYVSNWLNVTNARRILAATWSLSIEECFYVIWPVLVAVLLRDGRRAVLLAAGLFTLGSFAARFALFGEFASYPRIYFGLDTRADALAVGCACGLLAPGAFSSGRARKAVRAGAVLGFAAIVAAAVWADWRTPYWTLAGYSGMALASAAIVVGAINAPFRWLEWSPLVWTGRLSYSLYLWMLPVLTVLQAWPMAVQLAAMLAAAAASYFGIERPAQRLRARWKLERRSSPLAEPLASRPAHHAPAWPQAGA
jgi:peptidoglycan/LPS O-acetylase OafA/YrhL